MGKLKIAVWAVAFCLFIDPLLSQPNQELSPDIGQFLTVMTREQKLLLLEFMRAQAKIDPIDFEVLELFETLPTENRQNTISWIFKIQSESGQPIRTRVRMSRDTIDFGTISRGSELRDSVIIYNEGDQPYIISETVANCGCTIPDYPNRPIMPGDSAVIHILFDTRNLLPGPLTRAVSIRDNSSPNLRNLIWISARIVPADNKSPKSRQ